jgi:excisionase family DNA binding protein
MSKLLTTRQAAELLEVSEETLKDWRYRKLRDLRWIRIGRMVRYELSEVQAFITRHRAV